MNSQQDINLNITFDKDRLQSEIDSIIASLENNPVKLEVQFDVSTLQANDNNSKLLNGINFEKLISELIRVGNISDTVGSSVNNIFTKDTAGNAVAITTSTKLLGSALGSLASAGAGILAGLALDAAIKGIDDYVHRSERLIEAGKKAETKINDIRSSFDDQAKSINDIKDRYADLVQGVDTFNQNAGNLSTAEYEEFLSLNQILADTFPSLVTGIDAQGNAYLNLNGNISSVTESIDKLMDAEKKAADIQIADELPDLFGKKKEEIKNLNKDIKKIETSFSKAGNSKTDIETDDVFRKNIKDGLDRQYITVDPNDKYQGKAVETLLNNNKIEHRTFTGPGADDSEVLFYKIESDFSFDSLKDIDAEIDKAISTATSNTTANLDRYDTKIKAKKQEIQQTWESFLPSFESWASTDFRFDSFGDEIQSGIMNAMTNIDINSNEFESLDKIQDHLQDKVFTPLYDAFNDPANAGLKDELENLLSGDFSVPSVTFDQDTNSYILDAKKSAGEYFDDIKKLMDELEGYGIDTTMFGNMFGLDELETIADSFGLTVDEIKDKVSGFDAADLTLLYSIEPADGWGIDDLFAEFKAQKEAAALEPIPVSILSESVNQSSDNSKVLSNAFTQQGSSGGLTMDTYNELQSASSAYASCIEMENGVLKVNREQALAVKAADDALLLSNIELAKSQSQLKYDQITAELEKYGGVQNAQTAALQEEKSQIEQNIIQYGLMKQQLQDSSFALQEWQAAQNAPESGDNYRHAITALGQIEEGLKSGKVGTEKYKAAMALLVDESQFSSDEEAAKHVGRYFQEEEQGVDNFLADLTKAGMATVEDGVYTLTEGLSATDIAEKLKISEDAVRMIFGELEEYGDKLSLTNPLEGLEDMDTEAQMSSTLDAISKTEELMQEALRINPDADLSDLEAKLAELKSSFNELTEPKEIPIKTQATNTAVDAAQAVISMTTGGRPEDSTQGAQKASEVAATATPAVQTLNSTLDEANTKTDTLSQANIGDLGFNAINSIAQKAIDKIGGIGSELATLPEEKTVTINIVRNSFDSGDLSGGSNTGESGGNNTGGSGGNNTGGGTPTITSFGNAEALGSFPSPTSATSSSIKTLVGELGPEIIVRENRWFTVGNNGAEFFPVKKHDIVFNAKQTQQLLGTGKTSHGKALNQGQNQSKSSSKSTKKFTDTIDWFAKQLDKINAKLTILKGKISNSSALSTLIKLTDKTVNEQSNLLTWSKKNADKSKKQYSKALNKLTKSDQQKVKSGVSSSSDFIVSDKKGDTSKREDNVNAAIAARDTYHSDLAKTETARKELTDAAKTRAEIYWDKAEEKISRITSKMNVLDAKLANAKGWKAQNKIIEDTVGLQKKVVKEQKIAVEGNKKDVQGSAAEIKKLTGNKYATQIKNNQQISTKGLSGEELKAVTRYNEFLKELRKNTDLLDESTEKLATDIRKAALDSFNNITDNVELRLQNISARETKVQNEISLTEAKGQIVDPALYQEMKRLNNQELERLLQKQKDQKQVFDKAAANGLTAADDEWHQMRNEMYATDAQIQDATKSAIEFDNAIRDLEWASFDRLMKQFEAVTNEADFLIDLLSSKDMFDDDGKITAEGLASQGLHAQNYNTYMKQADDYKKEYMKIKADTTDQNELARRNELIALQQKAIKAAEGEKKAIVDLVEKGIKKEIEARTELIRKQKEALDQEKKQHDYKKNIDQKTKQILALERQIKALEGDDSLANQKKLRELRAQLAAAKEDLDETKYSHYIDEEKERLDNSLEEFKEDKENALKDTEKIVADTLKTVNDSSAQIAKTIEKTAQETGYSITTNIMDAWKQSGNAVTTYSGIFKDASAESLNILDDLRKQWEEVAAAAKKAGEESVAAMQAETKNGSKSPSASKSSSDLKTEISPYGLNSEVIDTGTSPDINSSWNVPNITWDDFLKNTSGNGLKGSGFATGGIVQQAIRKNGDDGLATLKKGETVLTDKFTKLLPEAIRTMQEFANEKALQFPYNSLIGSSSIFSPNADATNNHVTVSLNAPLIHCDNLDENLLFKLQKDKTLQKYIQESVSNQLLGGSKLAANRIA